MKTRHGIFLLCMIAVCWIAVATAVANNQEDNFVLEETHLVKCETSTAYVVWIPEIHTNDIEKDKDSLWEEIQINTEQFLFFVAESDQKEAEFVGQSISIVDYTSPSTPGTIFGFAFCTNKSREEILAILRKAL